MTPIRVFLALVICAAVLPAQLSRDQRRIDFEQLAGFVSRAYAPYEWKRDAFGFDALQIAGWLERVDQAGSDLEYFEICMEYVASLRDLHSGFFLPSDYIASIPIGVDLYDGKPLIDSILRARLPEALYPFQIGDEIVSVDGEPVEDWIQRVARLQSFANPRATRRWALDQIFYRQQRVIPRAPEHGETASIVVRRGSGRLETFQIPWEVTGTPYTVSGPVPTPRALGLSIESEPERIVEPSRRRAVESFAVRRIPEYKRLRGFGGLRPVFDLPANFIPRQGQFGGSLIYSGTYAADGFTIGYLRIPSFPSASFSALTMLRQIDTEVDYFNRNADALVLDVMRNPGGAVCLTNDILSRFIPIRFRTIGDEFRPTYDLVQLFRDDLADALTFGADDITIALLAAFLNDIETSYYQYRGRTGPLPACGFSLDIEPVRNPDGSLFAFGKPMIVLIDEFSASSADAFPVVLQDANRALMFGKSTAGGGGLVTFRRVGFYAEAAATLSISLGIRPNVVQLPGLPAAPYIENIGAWTDFDVDIMTEDNLLNNGRSFVQAFTAAIVEHIHRSRQ